MVVTPRLSASEADWRNCIGSEIVGDESGALKVDTAEPRLAK